MRPHRLFTTVIVTLALAGDAARCQPAEQGGTLPPRVPGKLRVHLRQRQEATAGATGVHVVETTADWNAAETAIIICDMWADHPCKLAAQRVSVLAPRMNRVVSAARSHGVTIIHAPSGGVRHYEDTPYRRRIKSAPPAEPPVPIKSWCYLDTAREPKLPIDDSDGGCDDPMPLPNPDFDRHEHPAIAIIGYDGISDNGREIFNYFRQIGIKNVVLMGVHTNMCVLGRSFGIRQMRYLGMNVVLARDLTDAMYDPRDRPHVSHARGTELVIEHIERHWCPSIAGDDLTNVVRQSADPNPAADQP